MTDIDLTVIKRIHFVGIGGIGVSALARMMLHEGKKVSGSDINESQITNELQNMGAVITIGQDFNLVPKDCDLVVYTIALLESDPQFIEKLRDLNIPKLTYPQMLGLVSKGKYTIAVAGTHGKTTTTAMIADVFIAGGLDPTVVVGSLLRSKGNKGSNFIPGEGKYFVVEACEYQRSFLNLHPNILVITNIDNDHLDYYHDLDDIVSAFNELALKVPEDGFIICDPKNNSVAQALSGSKATIKDYTLTDSFGLELKVPGAHNVRNAQAALTVGQILNVPNAVSRKALGEFAGTWRRFEYHGVTQTGALVFDDYAHHPAEVRATIAGLKEKFPDHKITIIFQPHLYSRTKLLIDDFASAFIGADKLILLPIYAAREAFDDSINSAMLAEKMQDSGLSVEVADNLSAAKKLAEGLSDAQTIIMTMGAGDVYKIAKDLVKI